MFLFAKFKNESVAVCGCGAFCVAKIVVRWAFACKNGIRYAFLWAFFVFYSYFYAFAWFILLVLGARNKVACS